MCVVPYNNKVFFFVRKAFVNKAKMSMGIYVYMVPMLIFSVCFSAYFIQYKRVINEDMTKEIVLAENVNRIY